MRQLDLEAIRARLASEGGRTYWRSLDELSGTPEFVEMLRREFPEQASEFTDPSGRRQFLKLMGASMALAGVTGCTRQPEEKIIPYVRQPEELIPGRPLFFATAMPFAGAATPVIVESHMGRPTKIEPNPDHPATGGGTDVFSQASILTLYDPDRAQAVKNGDDIMPWSQCAQVLQGAMNAQRALRGSGLRILTETIVSPSLAEQLSQLLAQMPDAKWIQWDGITRDGVREGARLAFGDYVEPQYAFDKANIVLSLDADFLVSGPGHIRWAKDFIDKRRLVGGNTTMNRLYVAESTPTSTGVKADHRLSLRASQVEALARAVAAAVGVGSAGGGSVRGAEKWIAAVATDLAQHRGASIVIAGEQQPPVVHALAHAINEALGNIGSTVAYTPTPEARPTTQLAELQALAADMDANQVDTLVVIGESNPVYTAPPDVRFADRMQKVRLRVQLSLFEDETARLCHWHVPGAHFLETWSDARAFDGTVSILQPLIAPLYDCKAPAELLATLAGRSDAKAYDVVREFWQRQWTARAGGAFGPMGKVDGTSYASFEDFWRQSVHDGFIRGSAFTPKPVTLNASAFGAGSRPADDKALEVVFRPDPKVWDGRFANNGWLQELPSPVTKITWDNVAIVSPATAQRLGVGSGYQRALVAGVIGTEQGTDIVELKAHGAQVRVPVWVLPGQPDDSITITVGYGRKRAGRVGDGVGTDVNVLRPSSALWGTTGVQATRVDGGYPVGCTQQHFAIENRHHIRAGTLAQYTHEPDFAHHVVETPEKALTMYPDWKYEGNAWGMSVDLNACVGCNACVVACVSENNIPVVGKEQVARGREMQWIRVDRYYAGSIDDPEMFFQPMMCQQCENAPCEVVCPVAATTHSSEGLNDMVYNRCVGTRYCSNNCPYKVRRFNFLLYSDWYTPSLKLARNPDVTVRSRGVMEKCTYCVQRINAARIDAKREDRAIRDGEIVTACESACPTRAIVFGNINDPQARVTRAKQEPRSYAALGELNVRPRTSYMAAVRNPNPELAPAEAGKGVPTTHD